jgi:hypothetical protein
LIFTVVPDIVQVFMVCSTTSCQRLDSDHCTYCDVNRWVGHPISASFLLCRVPIIHLVLFFFLFLAASRDPFSNFYWMPLAQSVIARTLGLEYEPSTSPLLVSGRLAATTFCRSCPCQVLSYRSLANRPVPHRNVSCLHVSHMATLLACRTH